MRAGAGPDLPVRLQQMKPAPFQYHSPATVEQAVSLLDRFGPDARLLAGGQALVPMLNLRQVTPGHVIDINRIAGLETLAVDGEWLRIGALVRHSAFSRAPVPEPLAGLLACMTSRIGHDPIRRRGTFVGALALQDPAAEWCLLAAVLGVRLTIERASGHRIVAIEPPDMSFPEMAPGDMIVEAALPIPDDRWVWGFREFADRYNDPAAGMALVLLRHEGGRVTQARIALAGRGVRPTRLAAAEAYICRCAPLAAMSRLACEDARREVDRCVMNASHPGYAARLLAGLAAAAIDDSIAMAGIGNGQ